MYQLILADIESNNLIPSSKYPVKYVELFFVSINIEIISINIPNIYWLFWTLKFLFCYFCLAKSQYYYTIKKNYCNYFLSDLYKHSSKRTWW